MPTPPTNLWPAELVDPAHEFSLMPFWFWNDQLSNDEILRQIDDFERHGVHGFVIHPRVGLPRDCGWMSQTMLDFMHVAIEEAARRGMKVILYDEGMYPSGSSSGQVVEHHPELACRGLAMVYGDEPLPQGWNLVQQLLAGDDGRARRIVDRPVDAYIRGLHYVDEGPAEDEPPAGDILNPATAQAVIQLVHEKFAARFGKHFGRTILGVFTDEPGPLGKCRERSVVAGTTGIVEQVSRLLGYDFYPHLEQLWSAEPSAKRWKDAWNHGIRLRMGETWYRPLSQWCQEHGIALCGHPDRGDEIGVQRYFHMPGQDLVWRMVEPCKPSALEGPEATQGKCSSSAMIHLGRRRNSNEFTGAYGPQTTFDEVRWLANWCLVRGVNLLIPHAFYYSIRGPRRNERPPQIGPHTPQWTTDEFRHFADACRRACWLNTDSRHLCATAILTHDDQCPWPASAVLLRHQRDFNYIDPHTLLHHATIDPDGIHIANMHYTCLILDGDWRGSPELEATIAPLRQSGRVVHYDKQASDPSRFIHEVDQRAPTPVTVRTTSSDLRIRWIEKIGRCFGLLVNEGMQPVSVDLELDKDQSLHWFDLATGRPMTPVQAQPMMLGPNAIALVQVVGSRCQSA